MLTDGLGGHTVDEPSSGGMSGASKLIKAREPGIKMAQNTGPRIKPYGHCCIHPDAPDDAELADTTSDQPSAGCVAATLSQLVFTSPINIPISFAYSNRAVQSGTATETQLQR